MLKNATVKIPCIEFSLNKFENTIAAANKHHGQTGCTKGGVSKLSLDVLRQELLGYFLIRSAGLLSDKIKNMLNVNFS